MDPNAALVEALNLLAEPNDNDDRRAAAERFHALADWLERGGFAPRVVLRTHPGCKRCRDTGGKHTVADVG